MSEKKERTTEQDELDYTVGELLQQLMEDDSWEPDPAYRGKAIGTLTFTVFPSC